MSIAMTSFASLPSISIDVTSTSVISSAAPVSDSTRAALLPSTRSLWFRSDVDCDDVVRVTSVDLDRRHVDERDLVGGTGVRLDEGCAAAVDTKLVVPI